MADWAPSVKQLEVLTEHVRQALCRTITNQYIAADGELMVVSLGHPLERRMVEAVERTDQGEFLSIDPQLAQLAMKQLAKQLEKFGPMNLQPLVLCSAHIRMHFKKLVDRFIPNIAVLSYDEIVPNVKIQSIGVVELADED
jgi:flagellar biosynthesis protein FlhA